MGKIEKESRIRSKKKNLKKIILQTVSTAGLISIALIAPGVIGALNKLGVIPKRLNVRRSRDKLIKDGLLKYDGKFLKLTDRGEKVLRHFELNNFEFKKPKKWDGKWRVLIFDIPESKRGLRDKVRRTLLYIGFVKLQNSVWVFPYDCEDYVNLIKADFKIGKDLLYMVVDTIENDKKLKEKFNLN